MNAPFWRRALAFVFDLLVINLIIAWPFQSVLQDFALTSLSFDSALPIKVYFIVFLIFIMALLYFTFLEYYLGQTPGQIMFKIATVSDNNNMTISKALFRNIFILPFFPFYIFWIVEPLHLAFYKQRILERWTRTNTVMLTEHNKYDLNKYNLKKVT